MIIEDYGIRDIYYSFIIYGFEVFIKYSFISELVDLDYLKNFVEFMFVIKLLIFFYVVLEEVIKVFKGVGVCVNVIKVFVVMIDRKGDFIKEEIDVVVDLLK